MQLSPAQRRLAYTAYNAFHRVFAREEVLLWPPVESQRQLDDLLPRLHFHFPYDYKIAVPVADGSLQGPVKVPYYVGDYASRCSSRIRLVRAREVKRHALSLALRYRGVLFTKPAESLPGGSFVKYFPNVAPFDPADVEMETFWLAKLHGAGSRVEERASLRRFAKWLRQHPRRKKAYLLCTGPSLARFAEFDMSDGYVIGCNSVVSNEPLMQHSRPVAIVANDPIFHWGPSIYAEQFRRDLASAARRHPFIYLTTSVYNHLIDHHLDMARDRICVMPMELDTRPVPLNHRWAIPQTANILTGMMIPLARTLADELYIIGADGREPGETYFWKHDANSQLTDKMQAIKDCHPAFFAKRDYLEYYEQHCEIVKSQIEDVEAAGGKVRTLTPSHIPALSTRLA